MPTTELMIGGMTCAACAARIEKKLNRLDGVEASVNYATEKARVVFPPSLVVADLIATVEQTGYTAALQAAEPTPAVVDDARQRLLVSAALAAPVRLLAMVPAWQFESWQWASLTLAAPVVVWGAFTGEYHGFQPNGETIEMFGISVAKVDDDLKLLEVEHYYDPNNFLGKLTGGCPVAH